MPGLDGIGGSLLIRREPGARIVFVTVYGDRAVVERGLATGALGYVLKVAAGDDWFQRSTPRSAGLRYVSRDLTGGAGDGAGAPTAT